MMIENLPPKMSQKFLGSSSMQAGVVIEEQYTWTELSASFVLDCCPQLFLGFTVNLRVDYGTTFLSPNVQTFPRILEKASMVTFHALIIDLTKL